ncbi:hypothetical protein CPB86DRAFT_180117 [Serendipita vermifera]|nr:hypothetical protein CPB86DRAFT_180117 [Serendipita vermifera]
MAPSNFNSDRDGPPRLDWIGNGPGAGGQFSESRTVQCHTGLPDRGAFPGYPDATQTRHPVPSIMAEQQREYSSRSRTPNRVAYSHPPSTSTSRYQHSPFQSLSHEPLVQQRSNRMPHIWEPTNEHGVGSAVSTSFTPAPPLLLSSEHWPSSENSAVRWDHSHPCW